MPVNGLGHFDQSPCCPFVALAFAEDLKKSGWKPVPLRCRQGPTRNPNNQVKILRSVKFQADPLCGILQTPPKSSFKHLILKTPLWQCAMSSSLKSPPKGLKNFECEKGSRPSGRPSRMFPLLIYTTTKKLNKSRLNSRTNRSSRCQPTALGTMKSISSTSLPFFSWSNRRWRLQKYKKPSWHLWRSGKRWAPYSTFLKTRLQPRKKSEKRSSAIWMSPSRPINPLRLSRPRRHTNSSVALSPGRRERNGSGSQMKCTQRIPGLASMANLTREFV